MEDRLTHLIVNIVVNGSEAEFLKVITDLLDTLQSRPDLRPDWNFQGYQYLSDSDTVLTNYGKIHKFIEDLNTRTLPPATNNQVH